jgi:hypothetical protein
MEDHVRMQSATQSKKKKKKPGHIYQAQKKVGANSPPLKQLAGMQNVRFYGLANLIQQILNLARLLPDGIKGIRIVLGTGGAELRTGRA